MFDMKHDIFVLYKLLTSIIDQLEGQQLYNCTHCIETPGRQYRSINLDWTAIAIGVQNIYQGE